MHLTRLVALLLLTAVGCGQSGLSPFGGLNGQWQWQFNGNPAGSGVTLSLATAGPTVTGTGTICGVGPACSPGAVTITGRSTSATFQLTIQGDSSFVATYSGALIGPNELKGTWVEGNEANTVIFYRK